MRQIRNKTATALAQPIWHAYIYSVDLYTSRLQRNNNETELSYGTEKRKRECSIAHKKWYAIASFMRDTESHYTLFIQDKQYQEKWTNNHIKIYVYEPQNPARVHTTAWLPCIFGKSSLNCCTINNISNGFTFIRMRSCIEYSICQCTFEKDGFFFSHYPIKANDH